MDPLIWDQEVGSSILPTPTSVNFNLLAGDRNST